MLYTIGCIAIKEFVVPYDNTQKFKVKIDALLVEACNPILDDGFGKNIAPLKKKKMISYDVLNTRQLKKYLNADCRSKSEQRFLIKDSDYV